MTVQADVGRHPASELPDRLTEDLVRHAVDEGTGLLVVVGFEVRRRHLQPEDALLRLAVLHVAEPREHRLDLTTRDDEVRLVDPPPAVLLTELLLLPEVDAVVAAGDRRAGERCAAAQHRLRLG